MTHITYFGYGSLVNVDTLAKNATHIPGRLQGWVREWKISGLAANGQGTCSLTVRPKQCAEIRGLLIKEPKDGLAALNRREARYEPHHLEAESFLADVPHSHPGSGLFVYKALPEHNTWGNEQSPILQSYLDCVLQGFYRQWGEQGVVDFFETTDGWHVPVLADRARPRYPRAIKAEPALLELVDEMMRARNVAVILDRSLAS
ncbi:hypothetical protein JM93_01866 [Roseibium hamelinense]|uniref:Gamma-glutamyl AIG2-like cyclotransferase n=1 Tax=Roseibium hamelinense TaxID=150831 RepID=A0A562TA00_9HYPH|nr:gamma-glutamylcyclotransferase [Roseibium hamelinense]MTI43546.1 gamma-glutamylcyclotransferase [Roseibium hamelinense]TWI89660.1 hypothetical protein JM93_01866 [Roseibium hamelinense]